MCKISDYLFHKTYHLEIILTDEKPYNNMNTLQAQKILNVGAEASFDEIKIAYRRLALELHPDKKTNDDGKKFQEINEAYNILKKEFKSLKNNHTITQKQNFSNRPQWGPPPNQKKPPEQDWSKYTNEFEDENPNFWKEYERKFWQEYNKTINADGRNGEYEKTKEPRVQPNLFIDVDPSLCIACQSCETIAPNVFHIDKESNMNPKSKVINMKGAGFNKIMNAAETCPTKAIIVENKDTKKRLYPL